MDPVKVFTLEEANQLIPELSRLLRKTQLLREGLLSAQVEIDALELVNGEPEAPSPELAERLAAYEKALAEFQEAAEEMEGFGCLVKDLELGLIDFYSHDRGKMVFLCWRLGEPRVDYWHDLEAGFRGRQRLRGAGGSPSEESA